MQIKLGRAIRVVSYQIIGITVLLTSVGYALSARERTAAIDAAAEAVTSTRSVADVDALAAVSDSIERPRHRQSTNGAWSVPGWDTAALGAVNPDVFLMGLAAATAAAERGDVGDPETLTIIDFSKPSTMERLWVYDLRSRALLYEEPVAHGRGSGVKHATKFSNEPESHRSSLGLFVTAEAYVGQNGYSLRLDGLEPGINDRARERAIVIHGAPYVNAANAKAQGFLGRSLGCPVLRPEITRELIDTIKGGGLVFAYYPEEGWLSTSKYLAQPSAAAAD